MGVARANRNGRAMLAVTNLAVAGPPLSTVKVQLAVARMGTTLGHERLVETSAAREWLGVDWVTVTVKGPTVAVPALLPASTA